MGWICVHTMQWDKMAWIFPSHKVLRGSCGGLSQWEVACEE